MSKASWPRACRAAASALSCTHEPQNIPPAPAVIEAIFMRQVYDSAVEAKIVRKRAEKRLFIDRVAFQTFLPGPDRAEHANAARPLGERDFLARTQFGDMLRLELVERSRRGVAQFIHSRQVLGDVCHRLRVLQE